MSPGEALCPASEKEQPEREEESWTRPCCMSGAQQHWVMHRWPPLASALFASWVQGLRDFPAHTPPYHSPRQGGLVPWSEESSVCHIADQFFVPRGWGAGAQPSPAPRDRASDCGLGAKADVGTTWKAGSPGGTR